MTTTADGSEPLLRRRFRVAMGDTDAAQVVYFAAPARWAESMMSEWLVTAGFATSRLLAAGLGTPAVHAEFTYRDCLRLDDELDACLRLESLSKRSFTMRSDFAVVGSPEPAMQLRLTQVYARVSDAALEALPLPGELVRRLQGHRRPARLRLP
ncbi:acyl-CoA thioesterase [Streptomyces sp. B21-083]|uniref:acyl-CoA thioesterase n=1 Tax=Streptomyces sp. B21-083 TaxID=3039410 RepID=UPI002FEE884A